MNGYVLFKIVEEIPDNAGLEGADSFDPDPLATPTPIQSAGNRSSGRCIKFLAKENCYIFSKSSSIETSSLNP
jgi:hypothetical protein